VARRHKNYLEKGRGYPQNRIGGWISDGGNQCKQISIGLKEKAIRRSKKTQQVGSSKECLWL